MPRNSVRPPRATDRPAQPARSRVVREAVGRCRALIRERGEAAGAAVAREALAAYLALAPAERARFFDALAGEFSPSPQAVLDAAQAYHADPSPATLQRLEEVVEPPRQELFRRLNMAPGGTAALVGMRLAVLLDLDEHPGWRALDNDLRHLLRSWFNRGFLTLERIDWHTSAMVLEKLIEYEAVHEIKGWQDLRRRLQADRRCFAFFHPQLPDEPLIFIEVALTRALSARVQPLLDVNSPVTPDADATCAVFYSITNCQEGLRGISFGNFLIKQVAVELRRELPRIRRFATLSPIPGFRGWLRTNRDRLAAGAREADLRALFARLEAPDWFEGDALDACEALLMPLAAHYLTQARRGRELVDPVARFHLGNGAVMERLNWLGDTSVHGMARSFGIMVNYVYRLGEVERNHELFVNSQRVIAAPAVLRLAETAASWFAPKEETPAKG
jgi:malonyl-CoA decarboxylase